MEDSCQPAAVPDYIRKAGAIADWMTSRNLTQSQAAQHLGKSQSAVANQLRLLRLSLPVQAALATHNLSQRHARALLRLSTEAQQLAAVEAIACHSMNAAQTEAYIDTLLQPAPPEQPALRRFFTVLRRALTDLLAAGIPVQITHTRSDTALVITIRMDRK